MGEINKVCLKRIRRIRIIAVVLLLFIDAVVNVSVVWERIE